LSVPMPKFKRLLQLVAGPPLFIGLLVFVILSTDFEKRIQGQQRQFGQATVAQLSDFLVPYVVAGDVLSLNVISAKMSQQDQVISIAIFDDKDQLLAQSGSESKDGSIFRDEMTFQGSAIGYVKIAVPEARIVNQGFLILPLLLVISLVGLIRFRPDLIVAWLFPVTEGNATISLDGTNKSDADENQIITAGPECMLVVRIRPSHHLARHFDRFFSAAEKFNGIVEQTTPEELVIHFDRDNPMYEAASAGLLIRQLTETLQGNMTFGGTIDIASGDSNEQRKAASYLASISEGDLLVVNGESLLADRAALQTFHHPMVAYGDLQRILEIDHQQQLKQDAEAIANQ